MTNFPSRLTVPPSQISITRNMNVFLYNKTCEGECISSAIRDDIPKVEVTSTFEIHPGCRYVVVVECKTPVHLKVIPDASRQHPDNISNASQTHPKCHPMCHPMCHLNLGWRTCLPRISGYNWCAHAQ